MTFDDGDDGQQVVGDATTTMKDVVDTCMCTTRCDNMLTLEEKFGMLIMLIRSMCLTRSQNV